MQKIVQFFKRKLLRRGKGIIQLTLIVLMVFGNVYGQQGTRQITGTVKEDNGTTIPGVNVREKGTTNGAVTNADGLFTIRVADNNETVLVFSFVGFDTQEIVVGNSRTVEVTMKESSQMIEEVVVVGYGTQKKESVIASISQATEKELKRTGNVSNFSNALTGQIPGLVTITQSGEPGGTLWGENATEIYLRGKNTWGNATPLILVDGIERDLSNIDVSEVASISVLKDASATAVFGVRGGNGVILINTKRGAEGKTELTASYTLTAQMLSKVPKTLNSYDALMAKNESIEREIAMRPASWQDIMPYQIIQQYRDYPGRPEEYQYIYPDVDWQNEMFKKVGFSHRANVNVRGGNKTVRYFSSLSYMREGDIFKHYDNWKGYEPHFDFNRFNFRSNVDVQLTRSTQLKINFDGFYAAKRQNVMNEGQPGIDSHSNLWRSLYGLAPNLFPAQFGNYWGTDQALETMVSNPSMALHNQGMKYNRTTELNSMVAIEQDLNSIIKGLTATVMVNFNTWLSTDGGIADNTSNAPRVAIVPLWKEGGEIGEYRLTYLPTASGEYDWVMSPWTVRGESIGQGDWYGWRKTLPVNRLFSYQAQLNYSRTFFNKHSVSSTAVFRREERSNGSEFRRYYEEWIGRVAYDYATRYLIELNGAYNGSEQFGPGYRFAFFPAVAVGWYLSNESFFNVEWIDKLKFRASRGKVGNDKINAGRWLYTSQYGYDSNGMARLGNFWAPESPYDSYYPSGPRGNPDICWEQSVKNNFGLEFDIFKSLFAFSFDIYNEDRTKMLLPGKLAPDFFGLRMPVNNTGHVKGKGYEVELSINKMFNQFHLWGKIFVAHNENKVIYREDPPLKPAYQKEEGYAYGQQTTQVNAGFMQNWDEVYASTVTNTNNEFKMPGSYHIIDFNGDGLINGDDNIPYGYSNVPQNTANLSLGFGYRGFSFMVQLYGVNNVNRSIPLSNFSGNTDVLFDHVNDYWSKDNPNASSYLPRWRLQGQNLGHYFLYDGSYLKLRSVELAYTFEKKEWLTKTGANNLRIYLQGNDLFFWSKMPDPRESGGGGGAYPLLRRVNLGIELSF